MKRITNIFSFLLISGAGNFLVAQSTAPEYKKYDWEIEIKPSVLSADESKENAVTLKDFRLNEYAYDSKGGLFIYETRQKRIKLNTDRGIEENNRMYIPMYDVDEVVDIKARAISKDGKIKVLDSKSIKDVENLEGHGPYKIFAFEGVEIGSEVEYLYTLKLKNPADPFGTDFFQSDEPSRNVEMKIISPSNLKIEAKCYNKFPSFSEPLVENGKRTMTAKLDLIPGLKEEKYSAYRADLMRVEYKIAYNENNGGKRINSWEDASERIYESMLLSKKDKARVGAFYKKMKIDKKATDEQKIRAIESYVKTKFVMKEDVDVKLQNIDDILKYKVSNRRGIIMLFMELFRQAGIISELGLTCDRNDRKFDGDFDTWNFFNKYLIYFPSINEFIAPDEKDLRLGYVPPQYTNTKGLFIYEVSLGEISTGTANIQEIPTKDYKHSFDNIYANIKFNDDFTETIMHVKREFGGYSQMVLQPEFGALTEEYKKQTIDALLKMAAEDSKITNGTATNYDEASILQKPFTVEGDVKSATLLDKAGAKYLFKIGNVIGAQSELYQEETRKTEVENEFNRSYIREMTVEIPDGYKISNPEAVNFAVYSGDKTNPDYPDCQFVSSYKLDGNKLKISIDEHYGKIIFPIEQFESFRKVINAAADFNKVVLFIEKK